MQNRKSQITLFFLIIIALAVWAVFAVDFSRLKLAFLDTESQLKQEYRTVWGDVTDGEVNDIFDTSFSQSGNRGSVGITRDGSSMLFSSRFDSSPATGISKRIFNGEDVVLFGNCALGGQTDGGCRIEPFGEFDVNSGSNIIIYEAHTFDTGYDVKKDGVKIGEFNAPNGFRIQPFAIHSGGRGDSNLQLSFWGETSRFCDIRDNEVWIQREFRQKVDIKVLEEQFNEKPTQFCHEARPFTLRQLGEGERAIRKQEGIIPFNRGEAIPTQRDLTQDEIMVLNYAIPIEQCQNNGCRMCDLGEANVWDGSKFVCESFLGEDEPRTSIERQIIKPTGQNNFIASNSFNFGSERFEVLSNDFVCSVEDGIYQPPNPSSDCYTTKISFLGNTITLKDSDEAGLTANIRMQYFSGGKWIKREDGTENKLAGNYMFTINNPLEISLNSVKDNVAVFNVQNNLPSGNVRFKIRQEAKRAELLLQDELIDVQINSGNNLIEIPFDRENLGINTLEVQSFYVIQTEKENLIRGQGFKFGFEVFETEVIIENEVVIIKEVIVIEKETEVIFVEKPSFLQRLFDTVKLFFINLFN